jgi:thioredoxin-related protein
MLRRHALLTPFVWAGVCEAQTPPAVLPPSRSLARELADAIKAGKPLVVMVSLEGCPFCKTVRQSYLAPMVRDEGLVAVQVDMQSRQAARDFKDAATTHDALIRGWGIKLAPTVLFFGKGGVEVAERLAGASVPDFYGAYLDERLATARQRLGV